MGERREGGRLVIHLLQSSIINQGHRFKGIGTAIAMTLDPDNHLQVFDPINAALLSQSATGSAKHTTQQSGCL